MRWVLFYLVLAIFDITGLRLGNCLVIRHTQSSYADYETNLQRSEDVSYVDWLLHEQKNRDYKISDLDSALALSIDDPHKSLAHFRAAIEELKKYPLNESGRELLLAIYLKIIKLKIPQQLKDLYKVRALDLITFHKELQKIPEYKFFLDKNQNFKSKQNILIKKEVEILKNKWKSRKAFDEAVLLINGVRQNLTSSWLPPQGTHQWVVISNAYDIFYSFGSWNQFFTEFITDSNFKPLIKEDCARVKLDNEDYVLQTQAILFYSSKCTPLKPNIRQSSQHLYHLNHTKMESRKWLIPAFALGAGLIHTSLQGKNIKFTIPIGFN